MAAIAAPAGSSIDRKALYRRLVWRNRVVAALRLLLPLLGLGLLGLVILQMQLAGLGSEFGIGNVSVSGDRVAVETPHYEGILRDGTEYEVSAATASASTEALHIIELTDSVIRLQLKGGNRMTVKSAAAQLDTTTQQLFAEGPSRVNNASGIKGTITGLTLDWVRLEYSATGEVHLQYPNGTILDAVGMKYDPVKDVWTFSDATMTLPSTPDQEAAAAAATPPEGVTP